MSELTDMEVYRLIAAVYPNRVQRVLGKIKVFLWEISDDGITGYLGGIVDTLELKVNNLRAQRLLKKDDAEAN